MGSMKGILTVQLVYGILKDTCYVRDIYIIVDLTTCFVLYILLKDLLYTLYLKICFVVLYVLLYNVKTYIVLSTLEDCIAIPSAEDCDAIHSIVDCIVIPSTEDCFMIRLLASSILLNVFALNTLRTDLPHTFHLKILFILIYELLYNVRTYIVIPTIHKYIAISFVEDYNVILATGDCLMIPLFASSTCLVFYLIH